MTQTGMPCPKPANNTFDATLFCGGSRVIPLNTSLGDHNNKSYNRFVDKNKQKQREREMAVEMALENANQRYQFTLHAVRQKNRKEAAMYESNR